MKGFSLSARSRTFDHGSGGRRMRNRNSCCTLNVFAQHKKSGDTDMDQLFDVTTKRFLLKTAVVVGAIAVILLLGSIEIRIEI